MSDSRPDTPSSGPDDAAEAPTPSAVSTPTVFVLFGATGDLAARMVIPAFGALAKQGLLPDNWRLIGNGRGHQTDDEFREHVKGVLDKAKTGLSGRQWRTFSASLRFAGGGFTEADPGDLADVVAEAKDDLGSDDVQLVHYIALPPSTFESYTKALAAHGLADRARVVYEKPFGTDSESFERLDKLVLSIFPEERVFRIDHFLGKEATQQLHVLRFNNRMMEQVWNRYHVAAVQIDIPETLGVSNRAGFYDETGATLDMLVTHQLQVMAEVALEPPVDSSPEALLEAREAVLKDFRPMSPDEAVLGQVEGYRDIDGVADDSQTDTFVAAKVWIDNDRWEGVPFLLRTGKQLKESHQHVTLVLRRPQTRGFGERPPRPETIAFSLAGNGTVAATVTAQRPGAPGDLVPGSLLLDLEDLPRAEPLPAYASLLRDVLAGDRALFTTATGLREAWRVAAPLLANRPPVQPYAPGSWGPEAAKEIAAPHGWLAQHSLES
ncbi:glucose-6-phosphate 1-dehydrogenase [Quadrisphaera granulorum]|uniref:Glucose-6-phosphate 1-dehydrogenase n=1 Tax=Quadrisphaera granulorum TaxID=317664 RepID=A0A316AED8_9ACTN|nr:glucose-6-phosphate dehydrogenase [Quadrisphaera granulorum]PWJ55340.1 glucose-6-phosphate 1-dehydrogenase [Quadrisphaera granulorum]SZE95404.1 glucose-6-phosphate 1-dehydrogenase [Quadrisphaera granulorum]